MSTKNVLIIGRPNYADEFDVEFFVVMDRAKWQDLKKEVEAIFSQNFQGTDAFKPSEEKWEGNTLALEIYFGTNEALIVDNYEDWLKNLKVKSITDEHANMLKRTFGKEFGTGSGYVTNIIEILKDRVSDDEGWIESDDE